MDFDQGGRGRDSAASAGETSDMPRFLEGFDSIKNRISPALLSTSIPWFQRTTLARFTSSLDLKRPIKRERAFPFPLTFRPCLISRRTYNTSRLPSRPRTL